MAETLAAITLTQVGTAISIAGTVASAFASIQQANYAAQVARFNASINNQNAERAIERSRIEAQDQDFIARALIGQITADQAASGLSLSSGSFALQRKTLRTLARQDAKRIVQAGDIEAFNFRVAAAGNTATAGLAKSAGFNSLVSGALGVAGDISSLAGKSLVSGALTSRKTNQFKKRV